jgi:glyoxylase I family protein
MQRWETIGWPLIGLSGLGFAVAGLSQGGGPSFTADSAVVRYQVADAERSAEFYTKQLGFKVELKNGSVIALVSRGKLTVILGGPGSSGSRSMPDGRKQTPGGWNRIVLYVNDLSAHIERLKKAGVRFRNQLESGPGGSQILIEDPDGNPIELHEAPKS